MPSGFQPWSACCWAGGPLGDHRADLLPCPQGSQGLLTAHGLTEYGHLPDTDALGQLAAGVLEAELTAAGIPHDLKVYPGAKHAFFNDQLRVYHPAAAADSWQRVLAFFAEHVRRGRQERSEA